MVEPPTATAVPDGRRETEVPEIVRAGAPGLSVWLPKMISEPRPLERSSRQM